MNQDDEITRRDFFAAVGHATLLIGAGSLGILSLDYLSPNVLLEPLAEVNVGRPEIYPPDSVTLLSKHKVFIVRSPEGPFHALSAVCTHLGCLTKYRTKERDIACPCHGSSFNATDGLVRSGPAPSPLHNLKLTLSERNELWVNRNVIVKPGTRLKV
jgi:cytochrome b6-f complex iron-sulfur subunit